MLKKIIFLCFFCFSFLQTFAQFYNTGQDPASLRWKQINTENFQVIFPDFYEPQAQQIANTYQYLFTHTNTLNHTPRKISVIVHAKGGISNGMVAWAPKRTELYTVPSQEANEEWLEHLCTHEYRHVVQIDKVNKYTTHVLSFFFGEQIVIGIGGVYMPNWMMEGDAVAFESSVGKIGRGRSPEFINEAKAMLIEKGIYSYEKTALGSVRDYVPNHYNMGYFMTAGARQFYGSTVWESTLKHIAKVPLGITSFKRMLRIIQKNNREELWSDSIFRSSFINPDEIKQANTHRNAKRMLFNDIYTNLRQQWQNEYQSGSSFDSLTVYTPVFANYYYPTQTPYGLVTYKSGLRETGAFVILGAEQEKMIVRTGKLYDQKFAYSHDKLYWVEYRNDLRWEHGGRQVLASYDLKKHRYHRHQSTYNRFAPFAIENGIGVVEVDDSQNAFIVLLDSNLHEINRIAAKPHELFVHPTYRNGQILVAVQTPNGNRIERINAIDGSRTPLSEARWYEIDNPQFAGNDILFRASYDGNNALYRLSDSTLTRIVSAPFGVRFPSIAKDSLLFAYYTSDGYRPARIALTAIDTTPASYATYPLANEMAQQEGHIAFANDSTFATQKYRGLRTLFNVHSWGFGNVNTNEATINSGFVVHSQNKLNTLQFTTGYVNDADYENGSLLLRASYEGLRPKFSFSYQIGNYKGLVNYPFKNMNDTLTFNTKWLYSHATSEMSLPFNISRRNYYRSITPYAAYEWQGYHHPRIINIYSNKFHNYVDLNSSNLNLTCLSYHIMKYGLIINNQKYTTIQQLNPSLGQTIYGGYGHTPFGGKQIGTTWWIAGNFYFPGLGVNHSIQGYAGYQNYETLFSAHSRQILNPRGFSLFRCNQLVTQASYYFPISFPDTKIGSILYIKKLYGGLFYDTAHYINLGYNSVFASYGAEIRSKIHVFQYSTAFDITLRGGYENYNKNGFVNFTFSINY